MNRGFIGSAALLALMSTAAQAQEYVHWSAPVTTEQASRALFFPMGTPLKLTTRTELSTKYNKPGDRVYLEVAEPLSYQGQVILPRGSLAVGEVARVQRNGHFGKKGKLGVRLLYVQTPSGPVKINGQATDEGTSGTVVSFATIALVSVFGFFVHGTSANIPASTPVNAFLMDELTFNAARQRPQVAMTQAQPDFAEGTSSGRQLPAIFDPSAFGSPGSQSAQR